MRIDVNEIGGGKVLRTFRAGEVQLMRGMTLTQEFIKAMPTSNRQVLIENNYIQVWPKAAAVSPPAAGPVRAAERHVVALGFGRYNVIAGEILNDKPLNREQAHELAGKPMEAKKAS